MQARTSVLMVESTNMADGSTMMGHFRARNDQWQFAVVCNADDAMVRHSTQPFTIIAFTAETFATGDMTASNAIRYIREQVRPSHGQTIFIALPTHITQKYSDTLHLFGEIPLSYATIHECLTRMLDFRGAPPVSFLSTPTPHDKIRILVVDSDQTHAVLVINQLHQINPTWVVDSMHLVEGAVVTHLSFDVLVMANRFGEGMTGNTAVQIIRRDEHDRRIPTQRKVIIALWSANADGANIVWDEATGVDTMRSDLFAALNVRVEGS